MHRADRDDGRWPRSTPSSCRSRTGHEDRTGRCAPGTLPAGARGKTIYGWNSPRATRGHGDPHVTAKSPDVSQSLATRIGAAPVAPGPRRVSATYRVVAWSRWPLRLVFRPRHAASCTCPPAAASSRPTSSRTSTASRSAARCTRARCGGSARRSCSSRSSGPVLRRCGIVPVRRGAGDVQAVATMIRLARDGHAVGIFPEGTRRAKGWHKTRRAVAHTGTARVALAAGVPLVPAAIAGTERLTLLRRWRMASGRPSRSRGCPRTAGWRRRELTTRLMEAIAELEAGLAAERRPRRLFPRHRIDIRFADSRSRSARRAGAAARARGARARRLGRRPARRRVPLGANGVRPPADRARPPPGDEVAVSAITHPDMVRIVEAHGLRAVPVDVDPDTLAPRADALDGRSARARG